MLRLVGFPSIENITSESIGEVREELFLPRFFISTPSLTVTLQGTFHAFHLRYKYNTMRVESANAVFWGDEIWIGNTEVQLYS